MSERRSDAWATEVFDTILHSIRKNDFIMDLFEDEVDEADVVWALWRARNEAARRLGGGQGEESEAGSDTAHVCWWCAVRVADGAKFRISSPQHGTLYDGGICKRCMTELNGVRIPELPPLTGGPETTYSIELRYPESETAGESSKHVHNWVIFDELADQEQCSICNGYTLREWDPDRTRQRLEREKAKESEAAADVDHN